MTFARRLPTILAAALLAVVGCMIVASLSTSAASRHCRSPQAPAPQPALAAALGGGESGTVKSTGTISATSSWQVVPGTSKTITATEETEILITTSTTLMSGGPNAADIQPAINLDGVRQSQFAPLGSAPVYAVQSTAATWLLPISEGTHTLSLEVNGVTGTGGLVLKQGTGYIYIVR